MLAAISKVLNECTKPDQATPAALVLQGLHALCQAEVGFFFFFLIVLYNIEENNLQDILVTRI